MVGKGSNKWSMARLEGSAAGGQQEALPCCMSVRKSSRSARPQIPATPQEGAIMEGLRFREGELK